MIIPPAVPLRPPLTASPPALLDRLETLTPRRARLLERAVLEGASLETLAHRMGVSEDAAAVALYRAACEYADDPLGPPVHEPLLRRPDPALAETAERAEAAALVAFLAGRAGATPPRAAAALTALRAHAKEISSLAEARRAQRSAREGWLRGAAAVALVALALWMSR